jgi:peptide/nickel transport system substrate-binding protein
MPQAESFATLRCASKAKALPLPASFRRSTGRRLRVLAPALALVILVLWGCTKVQTNIGRQSGNPWTVHGVLRIGSYEDLNTLNPLLSNQQWVTDVAQMVYSGLIDHDDHANPIPDVALLVPTQENGGISRDGKTITYHLRHGVEFSDGYPLTSADVKFTWRQIMNPRNDVGYRYPYDQIASIDTPDPYTVIVHLKAPLASFVTAFMANGAPSSILPKHLLDHYADLNHVPFDTAPVGSGPFVVARWEPGTLLTLRANPLYWRGKPRLREILYKIIPNQNTLLTDLLAHDVDFYYDAPEVQVSTLDHIPGYRLTRVPNMTFEHITFNCAKPPFDDVRVRRAVAYAIDWHALASHVYFGLDPQGMADTPPSSWAYDPSVLPYPHDPAKARALLRAAGWLPDAAGVVARNGHEMRVDLVTVTGITTREKAEELIQQNLKDVGIIVEIHNYPANLLFAPLFAGGLLAHGKFNLALYAWTYAQPDPDDTTTIGPDDLPPEGVNYSFYVDRRLGEWQRDAELVYNRAQRRPYYVLIQHRIHDMVPFHTIVWRANFDVVNTDLRNFKPVPDVSDFWNSWEWQI